MHRRTLITTLTALASGCTSAGDTAAPQPRAAEQRTAERINQTRAESGVAALTRDDTLRTAARDHARDMATRGFYDHTAPDGTGPSDRVPCRAGETIHRGEIGVMETADGDTWHTRDPADMASYLVRDWTLSEPHYQILIDSQFRRVGVGIHVTDAGEFFGVADFC